MVTLYHNGTILTLEDCLYAECLAVENGKIVGIGKQDDLFALYKDANKVDLEKCTLMPSFIDAHSHFTQVAMGENKVQLQEVHDFDALKSALSHFIENKKISPNTFIMAEGFEITKFKEKTFTLQMLDACAPFHPLLISAQSGHMGYVNSLALQTLGISKDTPPILGGVIGTTDGALNGYLEENAFFHFIRKTPQPSADSLISGYQSAQNKYASYGITTAQEGYVVSQMCPLLKMLHDTKLLDIDLVMYPDKETCPLIQQNFKNTYHNHMRIGGLKLFLDGSPQGKTAWLRTPYLDGSNGYPVMTDEDLYQTLLFANQNHMQVLAHCNGDRAVEQYMTQVEKIEHTFSSFSSLRPVIIHAQLMGIDQMKQAHALHMMPSFFVAHVYYYGDTHIQNLGFERAKYISPALSAEKMHMPFTFHQDAPVLPPDMLKTISCAVNRTTEKGVFLGTEEQISVLSALKAVTTNAAYQYFEETQKGTLQIGKNADLVILDKNPLTEKKENIEHIKVLQTIKEGQVVYNR